MRSAASPQVVWSATYGLFLVVVVAMLPVEGQLRLGYVIAALALLAAVGALLPLAEPETGRVPPVAIILVFLSAVALLRHATAGGGGWGPLVLLAVIWAAARGGRAETIVALVGCAAVFVVPQLLIGAPQYPASGWRTATFIVLVGWVLVTRMSSLMRVLRDRADESDSILAGMSDGFMLLRDSVVVSVNPALCEMTGFSEQQLVGLTPPYPFWPTDDVQAVQQLGGSIAAEAGGEFELEIVRADGSRLLTSVIATPAGPGTLLTTMRDVTARRAYEEAIVCRADDLAAIAEVTRIVGHSDPRSARQTICQVAQAAANATTATIWELDAHGVLRNTCILGAPPPDFALGPDDQAHGACVALRVGKPLFIADAQHSPRIDPRTLALLHCASAHFQPIEGPQGPLGVLALSWTTPIAELSHDASQLLEVLAAEAATALERDALLRQLEALSRTDELTGLPNRRAWDELLAREQAIAARTKRELSVAILDLDHFKDYNDCHGHLAGDRLLVAAASAWVSQLRQTDVIARWGGEEFVLLLPGCDLQSAAHLIQRLRGTLPEAVTFSAGVACWHPTSPLTCEELVGAADAALYEAKQSGRDRITLADTQNATTDRPRL